MVDHVDVVARLLGDQPSFHLGGERDWSALPGTLRLIDGLVSPGDRTLETGSGASTVVFAASGADHTAISPDPGEHDRIAAYCDRIGISVSRVTFRAGPSDEVLPALGQEPALDVAFIDGKHAFPHPVVDFHFVERRLAVGGVLVLDDVPIRAVRVVYDFLSTASAWRAVGVADDRAAAFRKLEPAPADDDWRFQRLNRSYPDYSFVPLQRRARLSVTESVTRAKRHAGTIPALRSVARRLR